MPAFCTLQAASKIARACIARDLGIDDAQPAAAVAEHRVELVQFLRRARAIVSARHADLLGQLGLRRGVVRQELVQRRIEQADRHRLAVHRAEQAVEVVALERQQLGQRLLAVRRASRARIISRNSSMWSKNMCSVRHRPIPSAPKAIASAA